MHYSDESLKDMGIMVVDDNATNVLLVERLLQFSGFTNVKSVTDSRQVLDTVHDFAPDLVLLDLHMPHLDGYEVLSQLRNIEEESTFLPILVFTADASETAKNKALALGASDFLTKPGDATEILQRVRNFLRARRMHVALQLQNQDLESRVRERTIELEEARMEIFEHLARAGEFRDDETGEHTRRVGELSAQIAAAVNMSDKDVQLIRFAAKLHDIGKIGIPDSVLLKPEKLTEQEFAVMRRHTEIGGRILETSKTPLLKVAREIAIYHHEHWDGSGYMMGLKGSEIPISARIVAVADVFDALTNSRPYKQPWSLEDTCKEIQSLSGSQFDPQIVEAFLKTQSVRPTLRLAA